MHPRDAFFGLFTVTLAVLLLGTWSLYVGQVMSLSDLISESEPDDRALPLIVC